MVRRKLTKKLAMLLSAVVFCTSVPFGVMAQEQMEVAALAETPKADKYVYALEDGGCAFADSKENLKELVETIEGEEAAMELEAVMDQESTSASARQLPKPSYVKWDKNDPGKLLIGAVNGSEGCYSLKVCMVVMENGKEKLKHVTEPSIYGYTDKGEVQVNFLVADEVFHRDGTYRVAVCANGTSTNNTKHSDWTWSDDLVFKKPSASLSSVIGLRWLNDTTAFWSHQDEAKNYASHLYFKEDKAQTEFYSVDSEDIGFFDTDYPGMVEYDSEYAEPHDSFPGFYTVCGVTGSSSNYENYLREMTKTGTYAFTVKAVTPNIFQKNNSKVTGLSPIKYTGDVESRLAGNIGRAKDKVNYDPEGAVDELAGLEIDSLALAMQTNDNVLSDISDLEKKYAENKNIDVDINASSLDDRFDTSKISITGAALNTKNSNTKVSLNFGKPDADAKIPAGYEYKYKNDIQFSMDLEGSDDSTKLTVPVRITMPVPKDVDVQRLCILHMHHDGTYEEIWPLEVNGDGTVSFTITSFSSFAFGQADEQLPEIEEEIPTKRVPLAEGASYASIKDNFAPVVKDGKINKLQLDFSTVSGCGVSPTGLKMTVIKGSKLTTVAKVKAAQGDKNVKAKISKATGLATVTAKKTGSVTFTMEDDTVYIVKFRVEAPKARKDAKTITLNSAASVSVNALSLFGTNIDGGNFKIVKDKVQGQAALSADGKNIDIKTNTADVIKLQYVYLNKKYNISIKIK